jgi:hypothetical protein
VSMEYSRKVPTGDGVAAQNGPTDTRVMAFGSVFLVSPGKDGEVNSQLPGVNVAELVLARGFGTVIRHRDFEERSNHYESLLAAESRATSGRKGIHSSKDPPVMHVTDLLTVSIYLIFYRPTLSCSIPIPILIPVPVRRRQRKRRISYRFYNGIGEYRRLLNTF